MVNKIGKRLYSLLFAVTMAIALSGIQFWAAINFSQKILWQVYIMLQLVGPGPILGYDSSGKPLYEGTPVHMLAAYFGLFIGVLIYTIVFYLMLKRVWHNKIFKKNA